MKIGNSKSNKLITELLAVETASDLCCLLGSDICSLEKLVNSPLYKSYFIKKKKGGVRQILAPNKQLKTLQKTLNHYLQSYYATIKPTEVHGFVKNINGAENYSNIVENAKIHTNKKYVLNIDLKDFFPSISAKQVKSALISSHFNYSNQIANAIILLCTYKGSLPIGAPTSPVLSNFVCIALDAELRVFCINNNLAFTRYADDFTFSSNTIITEQIVKNLTELICQHNFEINTKKFRIKKYFRRQSVTGLTVNNQVNVNRQLLKKVRAMLHSLTLNGVEVATKKHLNLKNEVTDKNITKFMNRLQGYINFIAQVKGKTDPLTVKYITTFKTIQKQIIINQ